VRAVAGEDAGRCCHNLGEQSIKGYLDGCRSGSSCQDQRHCSTVRTGVSVDTSVPSGGLAIVGAVGGSFATFTREGCGLHPVAVELPVEGPAPPVVGAVLHKLGRDLE